MPAASRDGGMRFFRASELLQCEKRLLNEDMQIAAYHWIGL
jgi:hypothetical protein